MHLGLIFKGNLVAFLMALAHWLLEQRAVKISALIGHFGATTCVVTIDAEVGQFLITLKFTRENLQRLSKEFSHKVAAF